MFTGIVEETAPIKSIEPQVTSIRMVVYSKLAGQDASLGDSIAVNGCCLTVISITPASQGHLLGFDLLQETWKRTNFSQLSIGSLVNLERSLAANGRLHGHFVTGHIDGIATVRAFEQIGTDWKLSIDAGPEITRYIIFKGAVAVDGISLTIAEVTPSGFVIWIIPHTRQVTNLGEKHTGSLVNIEVDMLAKYAEKFLSAPRIG